MKKLFLFLMIGSLLAACGNSTATMEAAIAIAKQRTLDSIKTIDSLKAVQASQQKSMDSLKAVAAAASKHESRNARVAPRYADAEATTPAPEAKKKGWSSTAKGAVIGAGVGAIGGAIIDKKHGEGAVVGGLIGAGAGAATGAIIDKNKKKKEAQRAAAKQ